MCPRVLAPGWEPYPVWVVPAGGVAEPLFLRYRARYETRNSQTRNEWRFRRRPVDRRWEYRDGICARCRSRHQGIAGLILLEPSVVGRLPVTHRVVAPLLGDRNPGGVDGLRVFADRPQPQPEAGVLTLQAGYIEGLYPGRQYQRPISVPRELRRSNGRSTIPCPDRRAWWCRTDRTGAQSSAGSAPAQNLVR